MTTGKIIDRACPECILSAPASDLLVSCSYIPFSTNSEKEENKEKRKNKKIDRTGDRILPHITITIHIRIFFIFSSSRGMDRCRKIS